MGDDSSFNRLKQRWIDLDVKCLSLLTPAVVLVAWEAIDVTFSFTNRQLLSPNGRDFNYIIFVSMWQQLFAFVCLLPLVLAGTLLGAPSCALFRPPATIVTQPGKDAYAADQVVQRLTEFSNLVKADTGTSAGNISYADAFTIIEWVSGDNQANPPTLGVVQIVQTTAGQGWKVGAKLSWAARIRPLVVQYPSLGLVHLVRFLFFLRGLSRLCMNVY